MGSKKNNVEVRVFKYKKSKSLQSDKNKTLIELGFADNTTVEYCCKWCSQPMDY